jgi:Nitroreductase family
MYSGRLLMPIGEAMFSQRSIRHFRPDPVPIDDIRLLMEAAVKAPNGGNRQIARFSGGDRPSEDPRVRPPLSRGVVGETARGTGLDPIRGHFGDYVSRPVGRRGAVARTGVDKEGL